MAIAVRRRRDPEGRMPLGDHLRELRRRLVFALIAVVVGAVVGWFQYEWLFREITQPLRLVAEERDGGVVAVNFGGITQPFSVQLKVAISVGLVISSPVWLYQLWAFIVPGLHRREKRATMAFVAAALPLFLAGCALALWVLPRTIGVLYGMTPDEAYNLPDANQYVAFVTQFIVAFGLAFLLPVLLVMLNAIGILSARAMLSGARIAIVLIMVFCALATPDPSAWSMFVLAIPMVGLYYVACLVAWLLDRRKRRNQPEWSQVADDEASAL